MIQDILNILSNLSQSGNGSFIFILLILTVIGYIATIYAKLFIFKKFDEKIDNRNMELIEKAITSHKDSISLLYKSQIESVIDAIKISESNIASLKQDISKLEEKIEDLNKTQTDINTHINDTIKQGESSLKDFNESIYNDLYTNIASEINTVVQRVREVLNADITAHGYKLNTHLNDINRMLTDLKDLSKFCSDSYFKNELQSFLSNNNTQLLLKNISHENLELLKKMVEKTLMKLDTHDEILKNMIRKLEEIEKSIPHAQLKGL